MSFCWLNVRFLVALALCGLCELLSAWNRYPGIRGLEVLARAAWCHITWAEMDSYSM